MAILGLMMLPVCADDSSIPHIVISGTNSLTVTNWSGQRLYDAKTVRMVNGHPYGVWIEQGESGGVIVSRKGTNSVPKSTNAPFVGPIPRPALP